MSTRRIPLVDLRRDGGTQVRETMNAATVQDYADALAEGAEFPAVTVFFDGAAHWLADGFHRVLAHERAGLVDVLAEVRAGSKEDALIFAAGANRNHGLPMGAGDRRRAVEVLLKTEKWASKSAREIAAYVGCSHVTVATIRNEMVSVGQIDHLPETRTGKDGKQYPVKKTKAPTAPAPEAPADPTPLVNLTSHPAIDAIASAPTRDALDAAYTAANGAGLSGHDAEEAGKVYQRRLSEMRERDRLAALRAEGERVAQELDMTGEDADLGAIQQGIDEEAARRRSAREQAPAPTPAASTDAQGHLFTQVTTPKPETAAADTAEVIALRAQVEALEAEVEGLRQWQRSTAARAGADDQSSVGKAMRLIALASSPNENEARNAAVTACRIIRERGLLVATSVQAPAQGEDSDELFESLRKEQADFWARMNRRVDEVFGAKSDR